MNLLIINHYAQTPEQTVGTRHFLIAKNLQKHGWSTSIISSATEHSTGNRIISVVQKYNISDYDGVKFIRIKSINYGSNGFLRIIDMLLFAYNVINIPKNIIDKIPSHVIGSTIHPFAALAGYILAKKTGARFFYEVRDIWPQTLIDMKVISKWNPLSIIFDRIDKFLSINSEKIISLAPYAEPHYAKYKVKPEKIIWIPNGIDFDEFKEIPPPKEKEIFDIYYIGAHGKVNELDEIIHAARIIEKEHPNIRINFVGDGPEKKRLQNIASDLSNVIFHDIVPKKNVPLVCQIADCFVLTAKLLDVYKYGISFNKIFDYMAGSRPIIFCCASKNNPIAESQSGITVMPYDTKALADAFVKMSILPIEKRIDMGRSARAYVEKYHNHKNFAEKLSKIFH